MLNLANASLFFYPGSLPPGHETSGFWKGDPQRVIAYEGLRYEWQGKRPCATGDPVALNWGPKTDLGLYGSSYVGMLGAVVRPTDVRGILQLDCLATDFFRDEAWPTFLCYNPYAEDRDIDFTVGPGPSDVYDAAKKIFVARDVSDRTKVRLSPDSAAVLVVVPANARLETRGTRRLANGVVLDFQATRRS